MDISLRGVRPIQLDLLENMIDMENTVMKSTTAERNEMLALIQRYQCGNADAQEKLLRDNSDLVRAVVHRFLGGGTDAEELYRIGSVGFWKAADGFDPQSGTRFTTCAVPQIAGEIRKYLRRTASSEAEALEKHPNDSITNIEQRSMGHSWDIEVVIMGK